MSLPHILVGLLQTPMSGYDLRQVFENSLGHFWSAHLSQIYPTLKKMEADGWIESEKNAPRNGPARIVYTRTSLGKTALVNWLSSGPPDTARRLHDVAQTYFLHELGDDLQAIEFLKRLRDDLSEWRALLESINKLWRGDEGEAFFASLSDEDFYPYLTLDLGLRQCHNKIEWCNDSIDLIKARSDA